MFSTNKEKKPFPSLATVQQIPTLQDGKGL